MNPQAANALARVRVVLDHPSHPGNIGSAARAMKTMGLTRLVLVAPRRMPDEEAQALATGAIDVLEGARVCASLREALEGTVLALGFSARRRQLSHAQLGVREASLEAARAAASAEVALVFGNEQAGLSNSDVLLCNRLVHIPSDLDYSSLNLAAAVQVAAYEMRMALGQRKLHTGAGEPATLDDLEQLYEHLEESLRATGFLDPGKPKRLMERLRRLFARAGLEREEVAILRGMLNAYDQARTARSKAD